MYSDSTDDVTAICAPKCDSCSAALRMSPASRRRGMGICEDCAGLWLLDDPETGEPTLAETGARGEAYEVQDDDAGKLEIRLRDAPASAPRLAVYGGSLEIHRPCSDPLVVAGSDLSRLRVKHDGPLRVSAEECAEEYDKEAQKLPNPILTAAAAGQGSLQQESGDDAAPLTRFRIVANLPRGGEICLLEEIHDVREAFSISEALKRSLD